jgi:non-heme Fe2+,alpha-ketoglutarate-dependent halogenase
MSASLTAEQVESYWQKGFVSRVPILTPEEAAEELATLERLEAEEVARRGGVWDKRDFRPWEEEDHPLFAWANALVRRPKLLDAVESILGPDILIRNCDVFIKRPGLKRDIGWHVDTAEQGPAADWIATMWLGLSSSTRVNGCLLYSAGSHRVEIPNGPKDKYSLTFTREAVAALKPTDTYFNEMLPGEASMHHFRIAHASGPNRSPIRRTGFVVRFMSPKCTPETAESGAVALARGKDTSGRFMIREKFPMSWTW